MRLEGRSSPTASTAQKSKSFFTVSRGSDRNVRYTTFARQTGATPSGDVASASELRERIATDEEREECLSGLLPNDSPTFATRPSC